MPDTTNNNVAIAASFTRKSLVGKMPKRLIRSYIYHQSAGCQPILRTVPRKALIVELVTGGRGWVEIENEWVEVTAGALLWNMEGEHLIARSDLKNPYRCFSVCFEMEHPFDGIRPTQRLSWWNDSEEVERFSREIIQAHVDEGFDRIALANYTYAKLLFQAQFWQHKNKGKSEFPIKLRQALELMGDHLENHISIRHLAREIEWSAPHLHKMFLKYLGITPHHFIRRRRIRLAQEKLSLTNAPIKQIAIECGFSNPSSFCNAFKLQIGITPHAYRTKESHLTYSGEKMP